MRKTEFEIEIEIKGLHDKELEPIKTVTNYFFPFIGWRVGETGLIGNGTGEIEEQPDVLIRRVAKGVWRKLGRFVPVSGKAVPTDEIPWSVTELAHEDFAPPPPEPVDA